MDEALKLVIAANPVLGGLLNPGVLKLLSDVDRRNVRDQLLVQLLGGTSEASFSPTFIDYYLTDNRTALETFSNADDWHPANDAVKRRCKPRRLNQLHGSARRPQRMCATLLALLAGFIGQTCERSLNHLLTQPFEREPRHFGWFLAVQKMTRTGYHLVVVFASEVLRLIGHQLGAQVVAATQRKRWHRDRSSHQFTRLVQAGVAFGGV